MKKDQFIFNKNDGINVFSFLKKFIIDNPLFNLRNQPNLDFDKYIDKDSSDLNNQIKIKIKVPKRIFNDEIKMKKIKIFDSDENDDDIIDDPSKLFDFIIHDYIYSSQFSNKIHEITQIMNEILEKPPYLILFGRIYINREVQTTKSSQKQDLNQSFFDGFAFDI